MTRPSRRRLGRRRLGRRRPRARRLVPGVLALLLGISIPSAPAAPAAPPAPPAAPAARATPAAPAAPREVEVARSGAIETTVAHLPGRLLAAAVARDAAGRYGLALLVADVPEPAAAHGPDGPDAGAAAGEPAPDGPRSVFFLVPGSPALECLASSVPERVDAVAALASPAGGADQLILGEPGVLYAVEPARGDAAGACRKLLAAPGLDLRSLHGDRAGAPWPRLPWLAVARAGKLELLAGDRSSPSPRELRPIASFQLPLAAEREPWGIKLTSSPVHLLPEPAAAASAASAASLPARQPAASSPANEPPAPRFAVGPEPQGKRRLRTLLLAATAGEAPVESWSLLPDDGQNLDSSYLAWNGRPALAVSSVPKFGVFVKRDLRLFLLARDRSRGGAPPAFEVHTECHLWHQIGTYFAAAGGGRAQDLVLIYPEGLSGKKLHFLVYADLGQGRLAAKPRVSSVDVDADDWFYGADLTGDGVSDLLVKSQGRLLLYPGLANAYRLADRPAWSFTLPAPPPRPKTGHEARDGGKDEDRDEHPSHAAGARLAGLADLRGDGHSTLFLGLAVERGRTALVAVRRAEDPPR
jgi:hypothetical protein